MTLDDFVARQVNWVCQAVDQVQQRGLNVPKRVEPTAGKKCPKCGKPMRKRTGQYGSFWGCTGYPACTATVQIGSERRRKKIAKE
ncbi:topoisomerase DNA-binding C4 zinc finger domain-containing protein [Salinisphaera sp. T31B1]|uniref:topoisomerase DNA-binding C4 zinc finger domain-containing protein n=1 Tax=Salinisphaera sp. T31B1 TaxID=727963 RepID=UPI00333E2066